MPSFTLEITAIPTAYPEITDIEYRLDGGSVISLGSATIGTYTINVDTEDTYEVEIRSRNARGVSPWSSPKEVNLLVPVGA